MKFGPNFKHQQALLGDGVSLLSACYVRQNYLATRDWRENTVNFRLLTWK